MNIDSLVLAVLFGVLGTVLAVAGFIPFIRMSRNPDLLLVGNYTLPVPLTAALVSFALSSWQFGSWYRVLTIVLVVVALAYAIHRWWEWAKAERDRKKGRPISW